jgi:hypothetical protein
LSHSNWIKEPSATEIGAAADALAAKLHWLNDPARARELATTALRAARRYDPVHEAARELVEHTLARPGLSHREHFDRLRATLGISR